ncbi:MAG: hypothetical protein H6736_15295 [Alphaproteobacteria bacterium]|nr:hypothetical protein [Alphaproteobacteria bacterium]
MPRHRPSPAFLAAQVRWCLGRGVPPEIAEDLVHEAWIQAESTWDPSRGAWEAYMQRIVRNAGIDWWRAQRRHAPLDDGLRLVSPEDGTRRERAEARQEALLDALGPEDRAVFSAWVLQKTLGKGQVRAEDVGGSLGLDAKGFEKAKRRLRGQLRQLLERFGWTAEDVLEGGDRAERAG